MELDKDGGEDAKEEEPGGDDVMDWEVEFIEELRCIDSETVGGEVVEAKL